ncbi:MAG: hypothetical protein RBS02_17225 [Steroidobacteraceae bacterium]|jgi:hypothetical protein|nr:hypothetical protein [Steroidobacteraceae bacterium]
MYQLKGEDLIPGLTMAEIEKSRLPLPDRESLDEEERAIFDELLARSKRFFESVPANAGQEYRLTPYFQGLLQSPRVARLWSSFGDYSQAAEKRGSFTNRDRELAELTVGMLLKALLGARFLAPIHVADAVGVGLAASDIQAIYDERFEDLSPPDRQLAEYVRATVQGKLSPELFDALAERMGRKTAIEYTSYICYRVGGMLGVRAMWRIQGRETNSKRGEKVLQAYLDGAAEPHPYDRANSWVGPAQRQNE